MKTRKILILAALVMGIVYQNAFFVATARGGDISDSLRAYWTFDSFDTSTTWPVGVPHAGNFIDTTEGIFDDVSANDNKLYAGNSKKDVDPYQVSSGMFGGAFYVDNDSDNSKGAVGIALHDSTLDLGDADFTVSFWQKNQRYSTNSWSNKHRGAIIAKFDDPNDTGWRFGLDGGSSIGLTRDGTRGTSTNLLRYNLSDAGDSTMGDGTPVIDGVFAHFLFTYDAAVDTLQIYENGVLKAEDTAFDSTDAAAFTNGSALSIGAPLNYGVSTSGGFGTQGLLGGLSNEPTNPAWVDDTAILATHFSATDVLASNNLATDVDLIATNGVGYNMGSAIKLLDVHASGGGADRVGSLIWSYSNTLTGTVGDVTGSGNDFTLVMDDSGGAGAMTGVLVTGLALFTDSTGTSNSWFVDTTWSSGAVPDGNTVVTIDAANTVNVDTGDGDALSVSVVDTGHLTIDATRTLTVGAGVDVGSTALLTINGGLDATSLTTAGVNTIGADGSVTLLGSLTVNSAFDMSATSNPLTAQKVTVGSAGSLTLGANLSVAKLIMNGSLAVNGNNLSVTEALDVNVGLDASGVTLTTTGAAVTLQAGTLKVGNSIQAGSLTVNGGALDLTANNLTVTSNLEVNGTLDMTLANMGSLDVSTAAVFVKSGSLQVDEAMTAASLTHSGGTFDLGGKNLTVGDLTLSQSLDMGAGVLTANNSVTINNATLTVANAVSTTKLTITGGDIAGAGSVGASALYTFINVANYTKDLTGETAQLEVGATTALNRHVVKLTGENNTYGGTTTIRRQSTLEVSPDAANLGVGLLRFYGNHQYSETILQTSGTFARRIGTGVAWSQHGGFAAIGDDLTVTLTPRDAVTEGGMMIWRNGTSGFSYHHLQLGSPTADHAVTFTNAITLNATQAATVSTWDNPNSSDDIGILAGNLVHDGTNDRTFLKQGGGTLWLKGNNDFGDSGGADLNGGRLQIQGGTGSVLRAVDGVGLPTNAVLYFNQGVFESSDNLTRSIGNAAGKVYWGNHGGFSAYDAPLNVYLNPANPGETIPGVNISWNGATGLNGKHLYLGSATADNVVTIHNNIDGGDNKREIHLLDNPYVDTDRAVLAGNVDNLKNFTLSQTGTLEIAVGATFSLDGTDTGADFRVNNSATLIVNGTLNLRDDMMVTGTIGGSGTINAPTLAGPNSKIDIYDGANIAPGDGVGTLTIEQGSGDELEMDNNSIYEWEVGQAGSTDTVVVTGSGALDLDNFKLKILDAGARGIAADDTLTVFTYTYEEDAFGDPLPTNTSVEMSFDNAPARFVTSELDANWSAGVDFAELLLTDDGVGTIYLTGLVRPPDQIDVTVLPTETLVQPLLPGQEFGTVDIGDRSTLTVDSAQTDIQVTNMTLGAGSMVRSTAAAAGEEVTITLDGTLSGGDGGSSSLGDETDIPSGGFTHLTLPADSIYEWTFSDAGGLDDQYVYVRGAATLDNNVTIRLVDNGGIANNEDVVLLRALGFVYDDLSAIAIEKPDDWTSGSLFVDGDTGSLILQNLVTAVAGPLPGDANGNGVVGDADWVIFKAQFGGAPGGVDDDADFNNDGRVDLRDLAILKAAWDGGAGAPELDATVTPEPATMSLLAIGGLLVLRRRRRKA